MAHQGWYPATGISASGIGGYAVNHQNGRRLCVQLCAIPDSVGKDGGDYAASMDTSISSLANVKYHLSRQLAVAVSQTPVVLQSTAQFLVIKK